MNKNKLSKIMISSVALAATGIAVPAVVVACSSTNDGNNTNLASVVDQVNNTKILVNTQGNVTLPQDVTSNNITNFINVNDLPNIDGITYKYSVSNPDNTNGTIELSINVIKGNNNIFAQQKTLNGFLTQKNSTIYNVIKNYTSEVSLKQSLTSPWTIEANSIDSSNWNQYINDITVSEKDKIQMKVTFDKASEISGSVQMQLTGTNTDDNTSFSIPIIISGFGSTLSQQITKLNLQPNSAFAAPQNTTSPLSFANSGSIFTNFDLNLDQLKELQSINNLTISVSNYSLENGTATLTFKQNNNQDNAFDISTAIINYQGFFKGTSADLQTSVENYFKNGQSTANWLNNYLNINPHWINNFIQSNVDTISVFFWGYYINNMNNFAINNISVSYQTTDNMLLVKGNLINSLNLSSWNTNTNSWYNWNAAAANTQVEISLPICFTTQVAQGNTDNTYPMNISTSASGLTTLGWNSMNAGIQDGQMPSNTKANLTFEVGLKEVDGVANPNYKIAFPFRLSTPIHPFENITF